MKFLLFFSLVLYSTTTSSVIHTVSSPPITELGIEEYVINGKIFQILDGKLFITDGSQNNKKHSTVVKIEDVMPEAHDSKFHSLFVTQSEYIAVSISRLAAVCVLQNLELMNCVRGKQDIGFGSSLHLDEQLGLLLIGAPSSQISFVSYLHGESQIWQEPVALYIEGVSAEDGLGSSIACVDRYCAISAPLTNNESGVIYVLSLSERSDRQWKLWCTIRNDIESKHLGHLLRISLSSKAEDVMLLQASMEFDNIVVPVLYELNVSKQSCDGILPQLDVSLKERV